MNKKKKTRKHKEKSAIRRAKQYASILDRITDSHDDEKKDELKRTGYNEITVKSPIKTDSTRTEKYFKKDLRRVLILILFFLILIGVLLFVENKYGYLDTVADNLMNFITR